MDPNVLKLVVVSIFALFAICFMFFGGYLANEGVKRGSEGAALGAILCFAITVGLLTGIAGICGYLTKGIP